MNLKSESALELLSRVRPQSHQLSSELFDENTKLSLLTLKDNRVSCVKVLMYKLVQQCCSGTNDSEWPSVVIFDGRLMFLEDEFVQVCPEMEEKLRQVCVHRVPSDDDLMLSLYEHLQVNMSVNDHLKLILILVPSTDVYTDLISKLNMCLFSTFLSVRTVMVVDRLSKQQVEYYQRKSICEIVKLTKSKNPRATHLDQIQIGLKAESPHHT